MKSLIAKNVSSRFWGFLGIEPKNVTPARHAGSGGTTSSTIVRRPFAQSIPSRSSPAVAAMEAPAPKPTARATAPVLAVEPIRTPCPDHSETEAAVKRERMRISSIVAEGAAFGAPRLAAALARTSVDAAAAINVIRAAACDATEEMQPSLMPESPRESRFVSTIVSNPGALADRIVAAGEYAATGKGGPSVGPAVRRNAQ
ncbi:hypothetical protein [Burkholderia sp. WAC0059]|uniref:hypothetical protein n=1 Tax=Burkholderia sp. WAC0059 TaxID=2066022 RepID=UPI0011AEF62F|nr:hypothetical protein [Burkholderia sp. WAC0059]